MGLRDALNRRFKQQHESLSPAGIPNIQELASAMFQLRLILTYKDMWKQNRTRRQSRPNRNKTSLKESHLSDYTDCKERSVTGPEDLLIHQDVYCAGVIVEPAGTGATTVPTIRERAE